MVINNDAMFMAQKFRAAEEKVSEERSGFYLFGLFEHPKSPGRWDLVVSASWLKTDRAGTIEIIALLRDQMDTEDWKIISSVFPIEPSEFYVEWITNNYDLKHQVKEVFDSGFSNVYIGHAFLITVDKSPNLVAAQTVAA